MTGHIALTCFGFTVVKELFAESVALCVRPVETVEVRNRKSRPGHFSEQQFSLQLVLNSKSSIVLAWVDTDQE